MVNREDFKIDARALEEVKIKTIMRLIPTEQDRKAVQKAVEVVKERVMREAERAGVKIRVEVEGSIAKDTWIGSDRDVDIFIIFPRGTAKDTIKGIGIELAKAGSGGTWKLAYAEHPYVEGCVEGCTVDIVPSVEAAEGEALTTTVDRTPLHTKYIKKTLNDKGKDEVRMLKQFMKGIEVYGAELKIGGFSGYLCELLVVKFGTLEGVVTAAAGWGDRAVVDIMEHYNGGQALEVFDSPLVVIDPVDRRRNVAAAVTEKSYSSFVSACRRFIKKPSIDFFFPEHKVPTEEELLEAIREGGSAYVAVVAGCPRVPSDILWGEIKRSISKITKLLAQNGFQVKDSASWSDEIEKAVILLELDRAEVGAAVLHDGPKIALADEEESFLSKYLASDRVVAGPYIRGNRWYVELRRKYRTAKEVIDGELPKIKFSEDMDAQIRKGFIVLLNQEMTAIAGSDEFRSELWKFLKKRPVWLK